MLSIIVIEQNLFCPGKVEKFNECDIFHVSEILGEILSVFLYNCF